MFRRFFVMMLLGLALFLPAQAAPDAQNTQNVYGPIGRSDTLWAIAEKLRPTRKAATQQVILAIYEKNKHAFTVNNINSLRKGAYMLPPTAAEVLAISRKDAINRVGRHNTRWEKGRHVAMRSPVPAELTRILAENSATTDSAQTNADSQQVTAAAQLESAKPEPTPAVTTIPDPVPEVITKDTSVADQLRIFKQELQQARAENDLLKKELAEARAAQKQSLAKSQQTDPNIQVQLDVLSHELKELRTILTQKDNHIKTLQSSLKSASEAIKSQHADNMRLYNKLKELSPGSIPAQAKQESGKPHIRLAAVTSDPATNESIQSVTADGEAPVQVWADESQGAMNPVATASKPANAVEVDKGVALSQLINGQETGLTKSASINGDATSRFYSVSPIAWLALLLSFVFILFQVIRALVVQNEIRKFGNDKL